MLQEDILFLCSNTLMISIFYFFSHWSLAFISHWDQTPCSLSQKHSFYLNRFLSSTHILAAVGLSTVFPSTKVLIFRNIPVLHPSLLKQTSQTALHPSQNGQWTSDSWVFLGSWRNLIFCSALELNCWPSAAEEVATVTWCFTAVREVFSRKFPSCLVRMAAGTHFWQITSLWRKKKKKSSVAGIPTLFSMIEVL